MGAGPQKVHREKAAAVRMRRPDAWVAAASPQAAVLHRANVGQPGPPDAANKKGRPLRGGPSRSFLAHPSRGPERPRRRQQQS